MSHPGTEETLLDEGETASGLWWCFCSWFWFLFGVFVWFWGCLCSFPLIMLCFLPLQWWPGHSAHMASALVEKIFGEMGWSCVQILAWSKDNSSALGSPSVGVRNTCESLRFLPWVSAQSRLAPGSFGIGTCRTSALSVSCIPLGVGTFQGPSLLPGEWVTKSPFPAGSLSEPQEDKGVFSSLRTFCLRWRLYGGTRSCGAECGEGVYSFVSSVEMDLAGEWCFLADARFCLANSCGKSELFELKLCDVSVATFHVAATCPFGAVWKRSKISNCPVKKGQRQCDHKLTAAGHC